MGEGDYFDMVMMDFFFVLMLNSMGVVFVEKCLLELCFECIWGGVVMYCIYEMKDGRYIVFGGFEFKFVWNLFEYFGCFDFLD